MLMSEKVVNQLNLTLIVIHVHHHYEFMITNIHIIDHECVD